VSACLDGAGEGMSFGGSGLPGLEERSFGVQGATQDPGTSGSRATEEMVLVKVAFGQCSPV
jgi:hypothetical protein